jgi:hypothetical protein
VVADLIDSFVEALQSHVPLRLRKLQNNFTAPVGSRRKETTNMEPWEDSPIELSESRVLKHLNHGVQYPRYGTARAGLFLPHNILFGPLGPQEIFLVSLSRPSDLRRRLHLTQHAGCTSCLLPKQIHFDSLPLAVEQRKRQDGLFPDRPAISSHEVKEGPLGRVPSLCRNKNLGLDS